MQWLSPNLKLLTTVLLKEGNEIVHKGIKYINILNISVKPRSLSYRHLYFYYSSMDIRYSLNHYFNLRQLVVTNLSLLRKL